MQVVGYTVRVHDSTGKLLPVGTHRVWWNYETHYRDNLTNRQKELTAREAAEAHVEFLRAFAPDQKPVLTALYSQ